MAHLSSKNGMSINSKTAEVYKNKIYTFVPYNSNDTIFRSDYINKHSKKKVENLEQHKLSNQVNPESKGELYFLRGRTLNVTPEYNSEAEAELGKATRFLLPDAWNELGECQYKKGDLNGAQTCFEKALALVKKQVYYRNMSMLMRSRTWKTQDEREKNVEKGLEYARQALKLDMNDGHSWLVLGNAYLASFFTIDSKLESLKNCRAAYIKAEKDPLAALLPELHFSKFHVIWYEEDYNGALNSLRRAYELEPTWEECRTKADQCLAFLKKLTLMVKKKGQLNQRRLNGLVADISKSQLGPYEKGGTSLTGNNQPILVPLASLEQGNNQDKVMLGKVVCTVIPESGIPFAFCLVDSAGTCVAVTVFNWASGRGVKIGDSVAVVAPVMKHHKISGENEEVLEFVSVRVAVPLMLVVNKRPVGVDQVATSQILSQQKPE
ncbi:unnamed protein product, partial [Meganyctiphanes norvegica]